MTLIVQITADCFICGHPVFLRHLRSIFNFKQLLRFKVVATLTLNFESGLKSGLMSAL